MSSQREPPPLEARIRVRVTPRAARDQIAGWRGGVLRLRVTAPPVEGRANEAVERLVAQALGLPRGAVRIVGGLQSRDKTVAIDGLADEDVRSRLGEAG